MVQVPQDESTAADAMPVASAEAGVAAGGAILPLAEDAPDAAAGAAGPAGDAMDPDSTAMAEASSSEDDSIPEARPVGSSAVAIATGVPVGEVSSTAPQAKPVPKAPPVGEGSAAAAIPKAKPPAAAIPKAMPAGEFTMTVSEAWLVPSAIRDAVEPSPVSTLNLYKRSLSWTSADRVKAVLTVGQSHPLLWAAFLRLERYMQEQEALPTKRRRSSLSSPPARQSAKAGPAGTAPGSAAAASIDPLGSQHSVVPPRPRAKAAAGPPQVQPTSAAAAGLDQHSAATPRPSAKAAAGPPHAQPKSAVAAGPAPKAPQQRTAAGQHDDKGTSK